MTDHPHDGVAIRDGLHYQQPATVK